MHSGVRTGRIPAMRQNTRIRVYGQEVPIRRRKLHNEELHHAYVGDQFMEDEMGGAYSTCGEM